MWVLQCKCLRKCYSPITNRANLFSLVLVASKCCNGWIDNRINSWNRVALYPLAYVEARIWVGQSREGNWLISMKSQKESSSNITWIPIKQIRSNYEIACFGQIIGETAGSPWVMSIELYSSLHQVIVYQTGNVGKVQNGILALLARLISFNWETVSLLKPISTAYTTRPNLLPFTVTFFPFVLPSVVNTSPIFSYFKGAGS